MKNLIAVLRGIRPPECAAAAAALIDAGFVRMEVTLNSPRALEGVALLAREFGGAAEIGAGTVLSAEDARRAADIGARFVVSPNCNPAVIRATKSAGMFSLPGVFTASECFAALDAGADALKLFPAAVAGAAGLRALRAVLPAAAEVLAVGGVDETQFSDWFAAGASGFGVGGGLYRAGMPPAEISRRAQAIVSAYQSAKNAARF